MLKILRDFHPVQGICGKCTEVVHETELAKADLKVYPCIELFDTYKHVSEEVGQNFNCSRFLYN